jgi:hypothetical protein
MSEILLTTATQVQSVRGGEWLLVEDPFEVPFFVRSAQITRIRVTLKRPDGTSAKAIAAITRPLEAAQRDEGYFCLLKNHNEQSVPAGTQLWLDPLDFRGE